MINKEKEKEFWKKYEQHIKDNKCQFVTKLKFCNRRGNYDCVMCNYSACAYCFKSKMNDESSPLCFNCLKNSIDEEEKEEYEKFINLFLTEDNKIKGVI